MIGPQMAESGERGLTADHKKKTGAEDEHAQMHDESASVEFEDPLKRVQREPQFDQVPMSERQASGHCPQHRRRGQEAEGIKHGLERSQRGLAINAGADT